MAIEESKEVQQGTINAVVRYFEQGKGKTKTYWEISQLGTTLTIRSGSIGTDGEQTQMKFESFKFARNHFLQMIDEMDKKGFVLKANQMYQPNENLISIIGSEAMPLTVARDLALRYAKQKGLAKNWIDITANRELRKIVGKKNFTGMDLVRAVDLNLIYLQGIFKPRAKKAGVETSKVRDPESIKLRKNAVLQGPYPKEMDLRGREIKAEIFLHMPEIFIKAEADGRPPQPNICIANDETLEVLHFPSDANGVEYAVIENLPNLREIHVGVGGFQSAELRWLILQNLPGLEVVTIAGGLNWLSIQATPKLKTVNVRKASDLDYFTLQGAPALETVDISGCVKLRDVGGLADAAKTKLNIGLQISKIQTKSNLTKAEFRHKGLTFTEVDSVLQVINQGFKLATLAGSVHAESCYGQEKNRAFNRFSYRLLRPLEHVYTGGTGETYAYAAEAHDYFDKFGIGISDSIGCKCIEECLQNAMDTICDLGINLPTVKKITSAKVFDYFQDLIAQNQASQVHLDSKK